MDLRGKSLHLHAFLQLAYLSARCGLVYKIPNSEYNSCLTQYDNTALLVSGGGGLKLGLNRALWFRL